MPSFDLTDRAAIVTGGSQGFGKAIALALATQGANVAVVAREPEAVTVGRERPHESVTPVVDEIKVIGSRAIGITADVREQEQVDSMVAETMDAFGRIDILINVVGGSWGETFRSGPLVELEPHDFIECYRVNVLTGFMCSKAVQPIMKAQGRGAIVNVASGAGVNPGTGQASYGAAKAAVINMSKSMAYEWAPEIRVNSIALGGIETPHRPMWAEAVQQAPATRNALARLGTPDEHAGTVLWLVSDAASFITGETIAADGGRR
ncbi:MAG: SDR family oxidoreductase [Chloroflexi bacterium]|nr:SDR family oxidoreductase [Chloroflexota bacterium]